MQEVSVIEQIHNEFDVAQQGLLNKANELLEDKPARAGKLVVNEKLVKDMEAKGFTNFKEADELKHEKEAKEYAKKVAWKVNYYFKHYPFHKFITKVQVKDICKKYGLVFGCVDWFIGTIPEKNMIEIRDFKVKAKDKEGELMIVGDKDSFDLKKHRLGVNDDWELKPLPDPDPIVLQGVRGGYLIVSKWDLTEEQERDIA